MIKKTKRQTKRSDFSQGHLSLTRTYLAHRLILKRSKSVLRPCHWITMITTGLFSLSRTRTVTGTLTVWPVSPLQWRRTDWTYLSTPPSSSPITERYNSEAAQTFASPVLSPSQVRLDRVTDLTQTLGVVQDRLDLAETERLQEATRQRPARNVQQPIKYKTSGWFGYK